jgi:exonuclease I
MYTKKVAEALDALTAQLNPEEKGTIVIVQNLQPDRFFTAAQQQRLNELMSRWRNARDTGTTLSDQEQAELEALVQAELHGAQQRADDLLRQIPK